MAREDRIDVFQAVGCRKHIHGIFDTIGRREHIHCISKKKMRLTSNSDCAHYLIDKLEFVCLLCKQSLFYSFLLLFNKI